MSDGATSQNQPIGLQEEPLSKKPLLDEVALSQPTVLDSAQGFGTAISLEAQEATGAGFPNSGVDTLIDFIVQKVIEKTNPVSTSTSAEFVSNLDLQPSLQVPQVLLIKSQSNDSYDEQKLIDSIPKVVRKKASELLKQINQNAQHITFNSSGNLFIDGASIPETNFFDLFPLLFRKKISQQKIPAGLIVLVKKIKELNLSHLISLQVNFNDSTNLIGAPNRESPTKLERNFWYIGP